MANVERSGLKNTVLRGFYDADVILEGAPIFRPGMMVYIDGASMSAGDATTTNALSRRLGFGGYYMIIRASHEMAQGKFESSIDCKWVAFGDEPRNLKFIEPAYVAPELVSSQEDDSEFEARYSEATLSSQPF